MQRIPVLENNMQLQQSDIDYWFQNRKFSRQSVKWLTPKYCNASLTSVQTWPKTIAFDVYETNDIRCKRTPGSIYVPQSGIWNVWFFLYYDESLIGAPWTASLMVNWNTGRWDTIKFYPSAAGNGDLWWSSTKTVQRSFTVNLKQWDIITLTLTWAAVSLYTQTQIRLTSYILY